MIAALIVLLLVQVPQEPPKAKVSPKASALGKEKPWWEKLEPGDMVRLHAIPGTRLPRISLERYVVTEQRRVREDRHADAFATAVAAKKWGDIHALCDQRRVELMPVGIDVQIRAIHRDPTMKLTVAEVQYGEDLWLPVAYLGSPGQARHPDLNQLPVLIERSRDLFPLHCSDGNCSRIEAIPYVEAERTWKDKQRRTEEIKRRAAATKR